MRIARLFTNETCNQRCAFCNRRRDAETPSYVAGSALRQRLDDAVASGASRIVLTGGEPLLRPDLERVVVAAKARGVEQVQLETNGLLLDEKRVEALRDAGVDLIRVHLPGWGREWENATGHTASFSTLLAALQRLQALNMAFEAALPIVRDTAEKLHLVPQMLAEHALRPELLVVSVPNSAPEPTALVSVPMASKCLERLTDAAKTFGFRVALDNNASFPPCLLTNQLRSAHLYALTPGGVNRDGHVRQEACSNCQVADRCPGFPEGLVARMEGVAPTPVSDDRVRRRLTIIGTVGEQVGRELATRSIVRNEERDNEVSTIVRVNFLCNQSCHFCFVSTHLPTPPESQVREAIVSGARTGGEIVLSGGEPTLNPLLPQWVRLAKAEGARWVELQTNATRLGEGELLDELVEAGVDVAFVSLHGATAETSDAVTNAPGTYVKTLAGLDALHESPLMIRVNFVFCELNRAEFPAFVELLGSRWPKAALTISVAGAFTDLVPRTRQLIPRFGDLREPLRQGLEAAKRIGMVIGGFESMCGIPFCQVPDDPRQFLALPMIAEVDEEEFVRAPACGDCDLRKRCHGIRRSYAQLYGVDEFSAIRILQKGEDEDDIGSGADDA